VRQRFVHADAALSGIPLALLDPAARPGFDLADGADSVVISGHKFLGVPMPCAVVVVRASQRDRLARTVTYTGSPDTTVTGSRSGHTPLLLWYALRRHGTAGLGRRAEACRKLAGYTHARLLEIGWDARHNPHAFTVVLRTPPPDVTDRWVLASHGGWSHIVCIPGVTREQIDAFLQDLATSTAQQASPPSTPPATNGRRPALSRRARSATPVTTTQ
jgi:histidine decarboxylase